MKRHTLKFLSILILVCITVCNATASNIENDDPIASLIEGSNNWQIMFRLNSYEIDEDFGDNKAMLKNVVTSLENMKTNPYYKLLGIRILGYASPDGAIEYNEKLSSLRATAIKNYIIAKTGIEEYHFDVQGKGENWEELETVLEESSWDKANIILGIIRETPEGSDPELAIKEKMGYPVYAQLVREYFGKLRSTSTFETFTIEEPEPEPEPVVEQKPEPKPEPVVVAEPEPEPVVEPTRKKRFGISTNLIYLAYKLTGNLELEYFFADSWSFAVAGVHRWDNKEHIDTAITDDLNIWSVTPELRWWITGDGLHEGWYLGLYGRKGEYDVQLGEWLIGDDMYRQGENIGGGISGGFSKKISKKRPFYLDFGLSVGVDKVEYDKYYIYEGVDETCNAFDSHMERTTFGLTRAKIAFQWRF